MTSERDALDLDNLIKDYLGGASPRALGARYGRNEETIRERLKRAGVPMRGSKEAARLLHASRPPGPWGRRPNTAFDDQIQSLYAASGSTIKTVALSLSLKRGLVRGRLIKLGIAIRKVSPAWDGLTEEEKHRRRLNFQRVLLPTDEIVARYLAGESAMELARSFGVDRDVIAVRLHTAGIAIRGTGEAQRLLNQRRTPAERKALTRIANIALADARPPKIRSDEAPSGGSAPAARTERVSAS